MDLSRMRRWNTCEGKKLFGNDADVPMQKLTMVRDMDNSIMSRMWWCCRKLNFPFVGNCSENDSSLSYKSHRRRGAPTMNFHLFEGFVHKFCIIVLINVIISATAAAEFSVRSVETVREFSCGKRYYRTFHQDASREVLYIGAMDRVFKVNLSDISRMDCKLLLPGKDGRTKVSFIKITQRDAMILNPSGPTTCVSKGKSEDFDCRNHIRVIQGIGDGSRLYVCGTNAHNPKDLVINWNLTQLPRQTYVPGIGEGVARCPYDPNDNSTAVWVEHGNPDNLPGLYSGTTAEFTKADTVIFRTDLYNMTSREKKHQFKRTLKYDSIWLDKPNFVGSFDIGDYVYFFFREPAVEYMNCGKNIFSRVARVCKKDRGGKNILVNNWVTYLKARLNCSIPGDYPFYFNEIQHVYKVPGDDSKIYAVFTTIGSGFRGSAVCAFTLDAIESVFKGRFKEQASSSSQWLPVLSSKVPQPRPGECVNDTQALPDNVLNFIRSHPIMDEAVPQEFGKPLFYIPDLTFSKMVVEEISISNPRNPGKSRTYTVLFVASNEGKIYKIVQWRDFEGRMRSELIDVLEGTYPEPVRVLEISVEFSSLYVGSDYRVRQIPTDSCGARYDNCVRCVRDPYCGWDTENGLCKSYSAGLLQNVGGNDTICNCRRCSPTKQIQANWGQSLYLQCAVTVPGHASSNSVVSQSYVWYHFPSSTQVDGAEPRIVKFSSEKYVLAADRGLVILSTTETDAGRWQLRYQDGDVSLQLCSYNVTVNIQKCSAPTQAPEFQKVYAEWCHEFQKYKKAMQLWQQKQEQCGNKRRAIAGEGGSNDYNNPNEIYPLNLPYG